MHTRVTTPKKRDLSHAMRILADAQASRMSALDEHDGKALLRELGIHTATGIRVGVTTSLDRAVQSLRPPFALKALSSRALHKSDIGAVALNIEDIQALAVERDRMRDRLAGLDIELTGFLVEEMVQQGVEIVIGGMRDPRFGPLIMCGLGGIFTEVLEDVKFAICPFGPDDARAMLEGLKGYRLLKGLRGKPPVDIEAIVHALIALGGEEGIFTTTVSIAEFDINPLIADETGIVAVDARFILEQGPDDHR
ncbi:MAG: acetate--CoA ligase family protein [Rhizobiales bacterium]|nr:acetate--CoA ligase family protein [Hyphomicrobiales bacterium]